MRESEFSQRSDNNPGAFDEARNMIAQMCAALKVHNLPAVGACLAKGEQLYHTGNQETRNAIENVFVFSFTRTFFCDEATRNAVLPVMPAFLYDMYQKQMLNSHI